MRYVQVSNRWRKDYGLGERDLIGVCHYDIFPDISAAWKDAYCRGLSGEVLKANSDRFDRPDGSVQWMRWELHPWHTTSGTVGGIVVFVEDISKRKQAEEFLFQTNELLEEQVAERTSELLKTIGSLQIEMVEHRQAEEELHRQQHILIQQNRHAAMGEMIGNIAHQWRQPLNTLGLFTQRLGFFYGSPSFNKEFLDTSIAKSMEIIQYMSRTIDDFRNFFSTEREKSHFRVDEAVSKALSLVEASFKERRIHIEREEREEVVIHGVPNEYAQVLLNIFINAKDAINERNVGFPHLKITIAAENGLSVVTISDNAGGIPEEILERIFDPYFTTKGPQQGTGVGLFMSKTIIENNMGGRLSVRNTAEGAEFRIEV